MDKKAMEAARADLIKISHRGYQRGLTAGSVSPFGLINDNENHVHIFLDEKLKD